MSDIQGNENVELDPTLDFLAGTVAGVSGLVVGFPFDTVKYRFQNPAPNIQYRSTFHALATITREERLRGLFKGISSPLASAPLLNGLLFATYRFLLKVQVRPDADQQQQRPTLGQIFLAGAGCGLASTLLTTPIELIKTQQQKQQQRLSAHELALALAPAPARVASARTVAAHIFRAGGVRTLYRGLSATILRDVGGFGMYFYGPGNAARRSTKPRCVSSRRYPARPRSRWRRRSRSRRARGRRCCSRAVRRGSSGGS